VKEKQAKAIASLDELMAEVRDGDEAAIETARQMLLGFVRGASGRRLLGFLTVVRVVFESGSGIDG
jgi:hypothetical protein